MGDPLNAGSFDPGLDYPWDGMTAYESDNPQPLELDGITAYESDNAESTWQSRPTFNRAQAEDEELTHEPYTSLGYPMDAFIHSELSVPYLSGALSVVERCVNFAERPPALPAEVQLAGSPEAVYDLQALAKKGYRLQMPAMNQPLCGIHALETSLRPKLAELGIAAPSIEELQRVVQSEKCRNLVRERSAVDTPPSAVPTYAAMTSSHACLSEEQLASVLLIVSERLGRHGQDLQLGVCSQSGPSGSRRSHYEVHTSSRTIVANAIIIWIVGGYLGEAHEDADTMHWFGVAPDFPLQPVALSEQVPSSLGASDGLQALPTAEDTPTIWQCTVNGCKRRGRPFRLQRDLTRHEKTVHIDEAERRIGCTQPNCTKRFNWPKDRNRHVRDVHTRDHPLRCLERDCPQYMKAMRNCKRHYNNRHRGVTPPTLRMVQEAVAGSTQ